MGDYTIEIIVFVIIVLVVASKPYGAMQAAESILGKFVLLAVVVMLALKSTIAGLLGALLLIVLSEGMREGLANNGEKNKKNKKNKKDAKEEKAKKDDGNAEKGEAAKSAAGGKKAKAQGEKADKKPPATKADQLGITETMEKLQKLAAITNKLS